MTYDYSEDTRWVSIESRRVVSAAEEEAIVRAGEAVDALARLLLRMPATLQLVRQAQGGSGAGGRELWCWGHERAVAICHRSGESCDGELLEGPADPTGTAAVSGDVSARHHREILRHLRHMAVTVQELDQIAGLYEPNAVTDETQRPGPDPHNHCRSCWAADETITIIERRDNGQAYYQGLCRRCGRWRSMLGGRVDLPKWFVELLHAGERITPEIERKGRADMAVRRRRKKR